MGDDEPCPAAVQMNAAVTVLFSAELRDRRDELHDLCSQADAAASLAKTGGSIIYSAQENDVYRIFRLTVGSDAPSALLLDNASQPRLSPDGGTLAYYSRKPGDIGLFGTHMGTVLGQGIRLSENSQDSADAPPSWSPKGDQLVYTSNNAGRYHIYVVWADGSRTASDLGYGKDPAWNPQTDQIVFNGFGDQGDRAGLWLMRADGVGERRQLTDNGNDQRPTWTPDGEEIVFMSDGYDGNWEVYRVSASSGKPVRLTNNPAQDGLPTVSPDGKYVAFMSDRGGFWRLWYVPIEGGEARLLGKIAGTLPSWLEYAIQWVN